MARWLRHGDVRGPLASNTSITWALKAYALGYSRCLPRAAASKVVLARGTSNYGIDVPSPFTAGCLSAREAKSVSRYLGSHHLDGHVPVAAAVALFEAIRVPGDLKMVLPSP